MEIEESVPLAPRTTLGVGGAARYFARVSDLEALRAALAFGRAQRQRLLVLGGGSNVLIPDEGFDGLVIKVEIKGIACEGGRTVSSDLLTRKLEPELGLLGEGSSETTLITAGAGESWDEVVRFAVDHGLWGIENLSGIPGTVGGAVFGNIGAYGQALSQSLTRVEVYDTEEDRVRRISADECAFGYRDSLFKQGNGRYIILYAAFALSCDSKPELSYKDLAERFANPAESIRGAGDSTLHAIREAVLAIRREKFPDLAVEGTAGSFFKNPILPAGEAHELKGRYPGMPVFTMPETSGVKIPLAWLLDHVLGLKGYRVGSARLFEKQPLVIVADRGGSARDCLGLQALVRARVREQCGIILEPEVRIIE